MSADQGHPPTEETAQVLWRKIVDLDKELQHEGAKKSLLDKKVNALRNTLREACVKLIFLDYEFALGKDVEQLVWKTTFYKVIEDYRKRLRKVVTSKTAGSGETAQAKEDLHKLSEGLRGFLEQASNFYRSLLTKFQNKFMLKLDGVMEWKTADEVNALPPRQKENYNAYVSCHRCLVFLGDIARYHKDIAGEGHKEWLNATNYYNSALKLFPDNGNPHNQLAVLATYNQDFLGGVYFYYRSIAVKVPFPTARENLNVLFDKNRDIILRLMRDQGKRSRSGNTPPSPASKTKSPLETFIIRFVRLHGILFSKISVETFDQIAADMLVDMEALLPTEHFKETIATKVLITNIFSIHNAAYKPDDSTLTFAHISMGTTLHKLAVRLSFEMLIRFMNAAITQKGKFSGPVALFFDWLRSFPALLAKPEDDLELSVWKRLRDSMIALCNFAQTVAPAVPDGPRSPLPEEVDVRGFVPLKEAQKHLQWGQLLPPPEQNLIRAKKLRDFGLLIAGQSDTLGFIEFNQDTNTFAVASITETTPPTPVKQHQPKAAHHQHQIKQHASPHSPQPQLQQRPVQDELDDFQFQDVDDMNVAPSPLASPRVHTTEQQPAPGRRSSPQQREHASGQDEMDVNHSPPLQEKEPSPGQEDDVGDEIILFKPTRKTDEHGTESTHAVSVIGSGRSADKQHFSTAGQTASNQDTNIAAEKTATYTSPHAQGVDFLSKFAGNNAAASSSGASAGSSLFAAFQPRPSPFLPAPTTDPTQPGSAFSSYFYGAKPTTPPVQTGAAQTPEAGGVLSPFAQLQQQNTLPQTGSHVAATNATPTSAAAPWSPMGSGMPYSFFGANSPMLSGNPYLRPSGLPPGLPPGLTPGLLPGLPPGMPMDPQFANMLRWRPDTNLPQTAASATDRQPQAPPSSSNLPQPPGFMWLPPNDPTMSSYLNRPPTPASAPAASAPAPAAAQAAANPPTNTAAVPAITSPTAAQLPFPFPGNGQQQPRYKTRNPFVS